MQIRDRIKELRRVPASELIPNPKNWRTHPIAQQDALRGVLVEVGYADALIARETPEGLMLVDGHLRAETTPDATVPVLVLDINEAEADLMLATLDPLAAMAGRDELGLAKLLGTIVTENDAANALLDSLRTDYTLPDSNDAYAEWEGMPEFNQEDLMISRQLIVRFKSQEDVDAFAKLIDQKITDKTKSVWYTVEVSA
tara:strand:+ start:130 stop:726 length:597 start_codon:yes stop_codon:yes gene_type:complete